MCGRFALIAEIEAFLEAFGLIETDPFPPRYNIAPTQPITVIAAAQRQREGSNLPSRQSQLARWGFLPSWVKDPRDFPLLINARAETAAEKASFRAAMRHRRVLVPASGFYEWRREGKDKGAKSQAYWIRPKQGGVIGFAGLMEHWMGADGSELDTAAILTTGANAALSAVHDRMPVVIAPDQFDRWLDCRFQEPREVADLLQPVDEDFFEIIPVSDKVNKVAHSGPELQAPVTADPLPQKPGKAKKANDQLSLF
ncbi:SOS response-associated peptidase [Allorhizobium sp. BGMRC 0089]|uniref:SOS response-associated peptidase n=1 Tax=Allorhizobium sonneratiae TaxID=2934936 RepID=UPI0020349409|nr:SOS response-associated peptidase [Allorhizobium sonneratiae]MCM2291998.1 SOS response-associated peptidase [Allorhizobium sonneratiae]